MIVPAPGQRKHAGHDDLLTVFLSLISDFPIPEGMRACIQTNNPGAWSPLPTG